MTTAWTCGNCGKTTTINNNYVQLSDGTNGLVLLQGKRICQWGCSAGADSLVAAN